jgi:hypothetical protein
MPSGLNPSFLVVERNVTGALTAAPIAGPWVAPFDCEVIGVALAAGAPGGTLGVGVNAQVTPTSQRVNITNAWNGAAVAPYNLWTAANVPAVVGAATTYPALPAPYPSVITPQGYAQNYPFPGPAGTTGFTTAQQTGAFTVSNPVLAPPNSYRYGPNAMLAPDLVYTDYNGSPSPSSIIHALDVVVLSTVAAGTGIGGSGLTVELLLAKR